MVKYFLIREKRFVKGIFSGGSSLAREAYENDDGEWKPISKNVINDKLMGYDPNEEDYYCIGNLDIMDQIRELSDEEVAELLQKAKQGGFLFSPEELDLLESLADHIYKMYVKAFEKKRKTFKFFYYKDKKIINPWLDEDGVKRVDPFEYYGKEAVEDYLVNISRDIYKGTPDARIVSILKKVEERSEPVMSASYKEEVQFAMSEEQAEEERCRIAFGPVLPDSKGIYYGLSNVPADLATKECDEWEKKISFKKENAAEVLEFLYPEGIPFEFEQYVNRVKGDTVWLIGFGD